MTSIETDSSSGSTCWGPVDRRGFVRRLGAAAIGLTLTRLLPGIAASPPRLAWRPDAFEQAFKVGDVITFSSPVRLDVIHGWAAVIGESLRGLQFHEPL